MPTPTPSEVLRAIVRNSKRLAVTVVGVAVVVAGLVLLVLPGPGIVVVVLGFAILGTEYAWAAAGLEKTKQVADAAGRRTKRGAQRIRRKVRDRKGPRRVQ
ncbi:MAG: PGPGW domain-containing protein [Actinomycetota bacterium]|nr:PGPGW domain-containing protein [Actinomycetota bacterium]